MFQGFRLSYCKERPFLLKTVLFLSRNEGYKESVCYNFPEDVRM